MLRSSGIAVSAGLCLGAAVASAAVDNTWDWKNCCRDLYFDFNKGPNNIYDLESIQVGLGPMGQQWTLKDAFISGVDIWNKAQANAANKWNLHIGAAPVGCPQITVQLGAVQLNNNPVDANNVPRFKPPKSKGQKAEDANWPAGGGPGNAPQDALAYFHRNMMGNLATSGEIYFNPSADWNMAGFNTFDPVILSLHELGHAMRLDDLPGTVNMEPWNGSIMLGTFDSGVHTANTNGIDQRLPDATDIADVLASCTNCVPAPGVLVPAAAALGFGGIRRRRAS